MDSRRNMEYLSSNQYMRLSDAEKEQYIQNLFDEISDDELFEFSDPEGDESEQVAVADGVVESDVEDPDYTIDNAQVDEADYEESDNESDAADDSEEINLRAAEFVAHDGTIWSSQPRLARQTRQQNILRQRSGPARSTTMMSIVNTYKCFMTPEMVDIIVRCTNKKAEATYAELNAKHPEAEPKTWKKVTLSEMYAFIGVLIMTGANRSNAECAPDLWSVENCPLYRASMGINRFQAILRFIRFDDGNTRAQRLVTDKAAPISELWTMMNYNFEQSYKPSEYLTVDEQLFPYRGRTRFTQYIPSKPAKYGIKVWWVCDAKNAYPLYGQIYTGQAPTGRETNGKPEMIEFYNKTKGGVDVMDQLLGEYTCQRMTKRWPLSLFFNMIDLTALAAYIIYYENNPNIRCTNAKRKRFLRQLAKELSMPIIEERSVNQQVMRNFNTKIAVASFISTALQGSADNRPSTSAAAGAKPNKQQVGSCFLCYIHDQHRRRTRNMCRICQRPICIQHSSNTFTCNNCENNEDN